MHHSHATYRATRARSVACALIASGASCIPASYAYGITAGDLVDHFSEEPVLVFSVGCAAGAVVGGLVASWMGRRRRLRLIQDINRLDYLLRQQMNPEYGSDDEAGDTVIMSMADILSDGDEDDVLPQEQVQELLAESAEPGSEDTDASNPSGHNVHDLLFSRLDPVSFDGVPVISRGGQYDAPTEALARPLFAASMDSHARAQLIDSRVPGFDGEVFPEVVVPGHTNKDQFEMAMDAMEDSMPQLPLLSGETAADAEQPEREASFDVSAYVNYLYEDEVERSRSTKARRFSRRPKLTVIEGTGDLSKGRTRAYKPRHLARVSKEA